MPTGTYIGAQVYQAPVQFGEYPTLNDFKDASTVVAEFLDADDTILQTLVYGADFTLADTNLTYGGSVLTLTAAVSGDVAKLRIDRKTPPGQSFKLEANEQPLEDAMNVLGMQIQEIKTRLDSVAAQVNTGNLPGAVFDFSTFNELENTDIGPDRDHLLLAGRGEAGDGAHILTKVIGTTEPKHKGWVKSRDGYYCQFVPDRGMISVRPFNVFGGGVIDEITGLQNASDFINHLDGATGSQPCELRLDVKRVLISKTWHPVWGVGFEQIKITGIGAPTAPGEDFAGTEIYYTGTVGAACEIQGGREIVLEDFMLSGIANDVLNNIDMSDPANLTEAGWDALLASVGITAGNRYARHSGIMIDPRRGAVPTGLPPEHALPDVDYPEDLLGTQTQGNKEVSSGAELNRIACMGFEDAVTIANNIGSANADFVHGNTCQFYQCKNAVVVGGGQSRSVDFRYTRLNDVYLALNNTRVGDQGGGLTCVFDIAAGSRVINLMEIDPSFAGNCLIRPRNLEHLHRIGDIKTGGSRSTGIHLVDGEFDFDHEANDIFPANVLNANNTGAPIRITNTNFKNFGEAFSIFNAPNLKLDDCTTDRDLPITDLTPAGQSDRVFYLGTAGGCVVPARLGAGSHVIRFPVIDVDDGSTSAALNRTTDESYRDTNRDYPLPFPLGRFTHQMPGARAPVVTARERPHYFIDRTLAVAFDTPTVNADGTIDATFVGLTTHQALQRGGQLGDAVVSREDGTVLRIEAVSGTSVTYRQLTNRRSTDGGVTWSQLTTGAGSFDATDGTQSVTVLPLNKYAPAAPLYFSSTSGSPDLTILGTIELSIETVLADLEVGDSILLYGVELPPTNSESGSVISAIDDGVISGTPKITLQGNAAQTIPFGELLILNRQNV